MRAPLKNIKFKGFDKTEEIIMQLKLSRVSIPDRDITVELNQHIKYGKFDSIWYGGQIATISFDDTVFSVVANGDVRATLLSKEDGGEKVYVKDKHNSGRFFDEMKNLIENDGRLYAIMNDEDQEYSLELSDSNWIEVFLDKIDGKETNESYIADSCNVYDAITEAITQLDEKYEWYLKEGI